MGFQFAVVALVAILLSGCAPGAQVKVDPITISAETAATIADRGVRTNAIFKQLCPTGAVDAKTCQDWATFYPKFKRDYATFYAAYKIAISTGDAGSAQSLAKSLEALSDQLLIFYLTGQGGR